MLGFQLTGTNAAIAMLVIIALTFVPILAAYLLTRSDEPTSR